MTFIMARQHGGRTNLPPTRLVVHCTVSPCVVGGALKTARYFAVVSRPASAHWCFDPSAAVRCLPDDYVGYHAPPNTHSLGYEMCDPQSGSAARWADVSHQSMMSRCARQIAADAKRYKIPIRRLTVAQCHANQKGICGHIDVSNAFHQTTHIDPGVGFPWTVFLDLVKTYYKGGDPTAPVTEDDMPTQLFSRSAGPQSLPLGAKTVLALTTIASSKANGISFAGGAGYFSGYVGVQVDSQVTGDFPVEIDLHTVRFDGKVWVPGSTIDQFEVGELRPGLNRYERPVQIYLPANYRLRAAIAIPTATSASDAPMITPLNTAGFTRLLQWKAAA